jgi:hypothetical protein
MGLSGGRSAVADAHGAWGEKEDGVVKTRLVAIIGIGLSFLMGLPAIALGAGQAEVVQDFASSIRFTDPTTGEPVHGLVDCQVLVRVEAEDGSATEWQACTISQDQPMGPLTAPATPVTETSGECIWTSDYWAVTDGSEVGASSVELTVTPTGRAYMWTTYPAVPLDCSQG